MSIRRYLLTGAPLVLLLVGMLHMGTPATAGDFRRPTPTPPSTANCSNTSVGLTPINDLGTGTYHGYEGGLYPDGSNQVPAAYLETGLAQAAQIQPLDSRGNPSPDGQIVLLSIGMSNTMYEFDTFQTAADSDPLKSSLVQVVNGAERGQTADVIIKPKAAYWTHVDRKLAAAHATNDQVQVIWLKEGIDYTRNPQVLWPVDAQNLQSDLAQIITILEDRFPNLRIVYLASRTYGGYASVPLNPDGPPQGLSYYAYDSAFAVKWLIQERIDGVTSGPEWLAWGPYLWADGTVARSDGLQWLCSDVQVEDGTHPSDSGDSKVSGMLLDFFHTDLTAVTWYITTAPTPTPTPCPPRGCH